MKTGRCGVMQCLHTNSLMTAKTEVISEWSCITGLYNYYFSCMFSTSRFLYLIKQLTLCATCSSAPAWTAVPIWLTAGWWYTHKWYWRKTWNFNFNPLKPELNSICYLLALLGAHHFLHVSRIRVKLLTFRLIMSYIYGAPILDVSRSHTTTQHSR